MQTEKQAVSEPPSVWGPREWRRMHKMSLQLYRGVLVCNFVEYLTGLADSLPCAACRDHYKKLLEEMPIPVHALTSAAGAFAYTVRLHNAVNRRLGKRELPLEEAIKLY